MLRQRNRLISALVIVLASVARLTSLAFAQEGTDPSNSDDKTTVPVVNLPLQPSNDVWQNALRAYLDNEIVVVEGATPKDMQRLLAVTVAVQKLPREHLVNSAKVAGDGTPQKDIDGILRAIAVRTTPEGEFHVFYGYTSGAMPEDKSSWRTGFKKWLNMESGIKEPSEPSVSADTAASDATANDAPVSSSNAAAKKKSKGESALGDAGPDTAAWTLLQKTSVSETLPNSNSALFNGTLYRLNSINPATDYYMVLTDSQSTPNFAGCADPFFGPCGWYTHKRLIGITIFDDVDNQQIKGAVYDHGPTGTVTSNTTGFNVGGSIAVAGPGVSAGFSETWTTPSVTTTDQTNTDTAGWQEDFAYSSLSGVAGTSSGTFLSHQAVIFKVPGGSDNIGISAQLSSVFDNYTEPGHTDETSLSLPVDFLVHAPVLSASPQSLLISAGGSAALNVSASIPQSTQGLSWNVSTGSLTWLSVPTGPFSTSQTLKVNVTPGTPVGTTGVISVDTVPPFAAPSVEAGPIQVQVTVGTRSDTTTTLTANPNPATTGKPVALTAVVAASSGSTGTLTGTVTFLDGKNALASNVAVSNGQASFSTANLPGGPNSLTAVYSGDTNFVGSTSGTLNLVVAGTRTIDIGFVVLYPNSCGGTGANVCPFYLQPTYLVAFVDLYAVPPTPTGTLTFTANGKVVGTASLKGPGVAVGKVDVPWSMGTGVFSLGLSYSGDGTYAATSNVIDPSTLSAAPATTSVKLISSLNPALLGVPVTSTATVTITSPHVGNPAGTVTFTDTTNGQALGTVTLTNDSASITTNTLAPGTHTIRATFEGANFASAFDEVKQVVKANETLSTLTASPSPANFGQTVSFQATVTPVAQGLRAPTGNVTFRDGDGSLGTVALVNGVARFSTNTPLAGGIHSMTAVYEGDAIFAGVTSKAFSLTVNPVESATNLTISQPSPLDYGNFVDLDVRVTDAQNNLLVNEKGTVTFSYQEANNQKVALGTVPLVDGKASFETPQPLPAGQYNLVASWSGTADFSSSASNKQTFAISPAQTHTEIIAPASGSSAPVGQPLTISFKINVVSPGGGTIVNDTVTVSDPNFPDSSCTGKVTGTNSPFTGSCSFTPTTPGTRQLVAFYLANDPNYLVSRSDPATDVVIKTDSKAALEFSNLTPSHAIPFGTSGINLVGTISGSGPVYPPASESVTVTIGGVSRQGNIGANGTFTVNSFPTSGLGAGSYPIAYSYAGNAQLSSADDSSTTLTVNKRAPVFSNLTASQVIPFGTASITLSGTIADGTLVPSGSVSITINGASTTAAIGADGAFSASFDGHAIPASTTPYAITYSYGGAANFNHAANSATTLTVTSGGPILATTTLTPGVQTCITGVDFILTIAVAPVPPATREPDGQVVLIRQNPDGTTTSLGTQFLAKW
jgi:Bacterial Ig-like domain (group 3)